MKQPFLMGEYDSLAFAKENWGPAPRLSRVIPFGYAVDPLNDKYLVPVIFELEALAEAKVFLKQGHSLRSVAKWLSGKTGRSISHEGLKRRVIYDKGKNRKQETYRRWAESFLSAARKARDFEAQHGDGTEWYTSLLHGILAELERDAGASGSVSSQPRTSD